MAFEMMDSERRQAKSLRHAAGERGAGEQRSGQARALGIGDGA